MIRVHGDPADYIGRSFDLLALQGADPVAGVQLQQTIFGTASSAEVCTGIQKLAQRWTMKFLTIRGSMVYLPEEGTDFVDQVRRGELQHEADVLTAFNIAGVEIRTSMLAEETSDMHDEDRMGNAVLGTIGITGDWIILNVTLTSLAGASRKVILPIPYLPIKTGVA